MKTQSFTAIGKNFQRFDLGVVVDLYTVSVSVNNVLVDKKQYEVKLLKNDSQIIFKELELNFGDVVEIQYEKF